jgi:putative transposase
VCRAGRSKTQRATRLWADRDAPRELAVPAEGTNEAALRARLRELAGERPRFGYRRLYIFLRREKTADGTLRWRVNHKRVYRLYREEGLAMQRRKPRKFRSEARLPLALPTRANEMWTMTTRMTKWPAGGNSEH